MKTILTVVAALLVCSFASATTPSGFKCHSEQYMMAKGKLDRMTLTPAQRSAIQTYAQNFQKEWQRTHRERGCSHHEAHASEFVAAAAGVLTDAQFKTFQGRVRNKGEALQHEIWQTTTYVDNLKKVVSAL